MTYFKAPNVPNAPSAASIPAQTGHPTDFTGPVAPLTSEGLQPPISLTPPQNPSDGAGGQDPVRGDASAVETKKPGLLRRIWAKTPKVSRIIRGGQIGDLGRLPRYIALLVLALAAIWGPITSYVTLAPKSYTSEVALILPGSGASASVTLSEIGQASSFANSPYASSSVSPTETYKRLLGARRVLSAAAASLDLSLEGFGKPRVKLVDLTGFILFEMSGPSPEEARLRAEALTQAFFRELDMLRADERDHRMRASNTAIADYEVTVASIRDKIQILQTETELYSVGQYHALVSTAEVLRSDLNMVDAELRMLAAQITTLTAALGMTPETAALSLKLHADPEMRSLASALGEASAALSEVRGVYGENHPKVVQARGNTNGVRARMAQHARTLTGSDNPQILAEIELLEDGQRAALLSGLISAEAEQKGLVTKRARLAEQLETDLVRIRSLTAASAQLDDLNRDYQVAEAVFASALAKTNTTKSDLYASYPLVQVLQEASLPEKPSSPNKKLAILAGVAACLFLVIGLVLSWLRRPIIDKISAGILKPTSPDSNGPASTSPETAGPKTTGPGTTGPETTGPETTGLGTTGPEPTKPAGQGA